MSTERSGHPRDKGRRQPDYTVRALDTATGKKGHIGAGWLNEDGSVSITLNMNTVIDTRTQDLHIRLFPNTYNQDFGHQRPEAT